MAHPVPVGLTAAEGRRFGLVVGGALLGLAALSRWRGPVLAPVILGVLGAALLLAGLAAPRGLGPVFRAWMAFGQLLSRITTPVFMAALYFAAITPMGLAMRALGRRPLAPPTGAASFWVRHHSSSGHSMERQY